MRWRIPAEQVIRDVHYATRSLLRHPGFSSVAVLTLALGIGANTAIFTVLDHTVLHPLAYAQPDGLMHINLVATNDARGPRAISVSYPEFVDLVRENRSFSSLAAYARVSVIVSGDGPADRIFAEVVSASYFPMLGVGTAAGRVFLDDEDRVAGSHPVAMISETLWRSRFGRRPDIIGRAIRLNDVPLNIVGVVPAWFKGESGRADVWVPMMMAPVVLRDSDALTLRRQHWHQVMGRLRPGVTPAQAQTDIDAIVGRFVEEGLTVRGAAIPLDESKRDPQLRVVAWVLFSSASFVVLIACVNLANLLMARGVSRQKEIAMRLALGASRSAIVRHLMVESVLLSLAGAAAGLLFAAWTLNGLTVLRPQGDISVWPSFTRQLDPDAFAITGTVVLFAFGLGLVASGLFGLMPALHVTRSGVQETLKAETEGWSARHRTGRLRQVAIAGQIALVFVLLAAAGLMARSLERLISRPNGIDVQGVLTFRVSLPSVTSDPRAAAVLFDRWLGDVAALGDVSGVARVRHLPIRERGTVTTIQLDDAALARHVGYNAVDPAFFSVFGVRVVSGRTFDSRDDQTSSGARVAVITETAAQKLFGSANPIGHRVTAMGATAQVVGVIEDVRYEPQRQQLPIEGDVYMNLRQQPAASGANIVLRTSGDPRRFLPAIRNALARLDPGAPLYDVRTMDEHLADSRSYARFTTVVLSMFAALALGLSAIGVYGTLSHAMAARRREIGIRMALGAERADVLTMMMRDGLRLCAAGFGVGVPLALILMRWMKALLYEVAPADPVALALAAVVLAASASLACVVPARRAASVDPVQALRR